MLHPLSPRPGPKVQVAATQVPLRDLRYTDVSIVDLGFKAKGTKSPFLVAANSSSKVNAKDVTGRSKLFVR